MMGRSVVSLLALAWAQAAVAQSTNIIPDAAPGLSLGTTVGHSGNTYTIDGGTTSGTNLFHSFSDFDLGAGDIAQWVYSGGDPAGIDNVVNRVTGGSPSSIMGIIDSTAIPNADFYFINPAGIVFSGQDAQVNVPAAAHFSTASELRFANGQVFSVATPSGSTLSVAAPQSFGFLGNEGDILLTSIENLDDPAFIANAGALSLSAANIIFDNAYVGASEQSVTAVGSVALDVGLDGTTSEPTQGRIEMTNSWLQTWAADCLETCLGAEGFISLNAGELALNFTGIVADFDSTSDEGGTSYVRLVGNNQVDLIDSIILADGYGTASAGDVSITSFGDVNIIGTLIQAYTQGSGDAGTIDVSGANVLLSGGTIGSESYGSGRSGSVVISADDSLVLENGSWVFTTAFDSGAAGSVSLSAANISLTDSLVSSESYGSGDAGVVTVDAAGDLFMDWSTISSASYLDSKAGSVTVTADSLYMDVSQITSNAYGDGDAGSLHLDIAGEVYARVSDITSDTYGLGNAGDVVLEAGSAILDDITYLSSEALGPGNGGQVLVLIDGTLEINDFSYISTSAARTFDPIASSGKAGDVTIVADTLLIDGGSIYSEGWGGAESGSLNITVGTLNMLGGYISTDSFESGNAGDIHLTAGSADIEFGWISSDSFGEGDGGNVRVEVDGPLTLFSLARISSDAYGSGDAGDVTISADSLSLEWYSQISSDSYGEGNGGRTTVNVDGALTMIDSSFISSDAYDLGNAGGVSVSAQSLSVAADSYVSSDARGEGDAGSVEILAEAIEVASGGIISSSTYGAGNAGGVFLAGGTLSMDGGMILSDAFDAGDAGGIAIEVAQLSMLDSTIRSEAGSSGAGGEIAVAVDGALAMDGSSISTNSNGSGDAGGIVVNAGSVAMTNASAVASDALSPDSGRSGTVTLTAADLSMSGASTISTSSFNANAAGQVEVHAERLSMSGAGTAIGSENLGEAGGDAGSVLVRSGGVDILDGARVTTNSLTGAAGDITFDMAPGSLLILSGETLPGVIETSSGPGTGGVISIASPLAIISNGGIISALGESGGANVQIGANYFIASSDRPNLVQVDGNLTFSNAIYDVSSGTTKADLTMVDASGVLQGQCSTVRSTGQLSQLNIRPTGPYGDAALPSIRGIGSKATNAGRTTRGACQ